MIYKATCACQASVELHEDIAMYDSLDVIKLKQERFDAKILDWEAGHDKCTDAWRSMVRARRSAAKVKA